MGGEMDTSTILRPEQLPFDVDEQLAHDINGLITAIENDDWMTVDAWQDEVHGSARGLSEENDAWVRWYYSDNGWMTENGRSD